MTCFLRIGVLAMLAIVLLVSRAPAQQSSAAPPDPQQVYTAAIQAKNWPAAIAAAQQMVAASATADHLRMLADAQFDSGLLQDALATYARAVQASAAEKPAAGMPDADWKARTARIYVWQGNTYLKLRRSADAVSSYKLAAAIDPNPSIALFNLCATLYNIGDVDHAIEACRKDVQVDPGKADGWFILGSLLFANGRVNAQGKIEIPSESRHALQKYLELAPTGAHANDVKQMLEMAAPQ